MTRRYRPATVETCRADVVSVWLVRPDDGDATVLTSLDGVEGGGCVVPTAEITAAEGADFRELLRQACVAARAGNIVTVSRRRS